MSLDFTDSFNLSKSTRNVTREGYLKAHAALTKVGIQKYDLSNITGLDSDRGKIVKVFRPDTTVFNDDTIESTRMKPITMNHPHEMVDSENYHNYSVGSIGENVRKIDKERLGATIQINDKDIVKSIMDGKIKELSMGYKSDIVKESGFYDNESYDYKFNGPMYMNHCAIVDKGRCGESVSILDKKEEISSMSDENVEDKAVDEVIADAVIEDKVELSEEVVESQEVTDATEEEVKESEVIEDEETTQINSIKNNMLEDADFLAMLKDKLGDLNKSDVNDAEEVKQAEDGDQLLSDSSQDEEDTQKAFQDEVNLRVGLIDKARMLVKDESLSELSNRKIMELALKNTKIDVKDKSDDYLMGVLDNAILEHEEAKKYFDDSKVDGAKSYKPRYFGATDIRKL